MQRELEQRINDEANGNEVKLNGKIRIDVNQAGAFTVGRLCVKGIVQIRRSDVIIDGSNAEIEANIGDCTTSDWSLFFIHQTARNTELRNLRIKVRIQNPSHSVRTFALIYNTAYGLKLNNCRIEVYSDKQLNMIGIYNNGNLDTHMETRADNLVVANSLIKIECRSSEFGKECSVYGLYNYLANSISVQNTFIYSTNRGCGERQKAIGVYTNGRFGRFAGNNIKANASHNTGTKKEQAYAFGFINDGLYSIITSNNIVGEWGGMCVGLENKGEYAVISNNKVLATHTICGRSIRSYGNNTSIEGNVLTSTSRNARIIEHDAHNCIIGRNIMEVLMAQSECLSGCGIYAIADNCTENVISENIIRNIADCAIFANGTVGAVLNNRVTSFKETVGFAGKENTQLLLRLDERNIRSISG
ncbi:MAG: hypothetical protein ACI4S9_04305 [Christensenellales bacterium]